MEQFADRYPAATGRRMAGWRQALLVAVVFAAVILLALRDPIGRWFLPGELIQPLDPDLEAVAIFVGTFGGVLAAARVVALQERGRLLRPGDKRGLDRVVSPLAALVIPVLVATATARWCVQEFAFAGLAPPSVAAGFTVTGTDRSSRSHRHWLRLRHGVGGRVFSLPVDKAVYDAARVGDIVALPVQTGRRGIGRMMPDHWLTPADLHHGA